MIKLYPPHLLPTGLLELLYDLLTRIIPHRSQDPPILDPPRNLLRPIHERRLNELPEIRRRIDEGKLRSVLRHRHSVRITPVLAAGHELQEIAHVVAGEDKGRGDADGADVRFDGDFAVDVAEMREAATGGGSDVA